MRIYHTVHDAINYYPNIVCAISLICAVSLFANALAKDIVEDLKSINLNGKDETKHLQITNKFSLLNESHSNAKKLSEYTIKFFFEYLQ